jgi:hypothetical protein
MRMSKRSARNIGKKRPRNNRSANEATTDRAIRRFLRPRPDNPEGKKKGNK